MLHKTLHWLIKVTILLWRKALHYKSFYKSISLERAQESVFWCACHHNIDKSPRYFIHVNIDESVRIGFSVIVEKIHDFSLLFYRQRQFQNGLPHENICYLMGCAANAEKNERRTSSLRDTRVTNPREQKNSTTISPQSIAPLSP